MDKRQNSIGLHIKQLRQERNMSQEVLANLCGFSNTMLSAYENNRKTPNLSTLAKIAKELGTSIDRLYYGDENSSFISSEPDNAKKIVNSIFLLWELGVINYDKNQLLQMFKEKYEIMGELPKEVLFLNRCTIPIERFITSLNDFKMNQNTYPDPEKYLEMLKASAAAGINRDLDNKTF